MSWRTKLLCFFLAVVGGCYVAAAIAGPGYTPPGGTGTSSFLQILRSGVVADGSTLTFANGWGLCSGSGTATLPTITGSSQDGADLWLWHDSVGTLTLAAGGSNLIHDRTTTAASSFTLTNGEGVHLKAFWTGSVGYWLVVSRLNTANFSVTGTIGANLIQCPTILAQGGAGGIFGAYGPNGSTSGRLRLSNSTESKYADIYTNGVFANSASLYLADPGATTGYIPTSKNLSTIDLAPVTAPAAPLGGAVLYCESSDGHVRLKFSTNTVVDLTPSGP